MKREVFEKRLWPLRMELLKAQRWIEQTGARVAILVEGRDGAGKTALIRRLTRHLDPRTCRVVHLGAPNERERGEWSFQRYLRHLPSAGELVIFDRSWYGRAGVEKVHGFCSEAECEAFLDAVVPLETLLVKDGLQLFKLCLDVGRREQARRLRRRWESPLLRWKLSPQDLRAPELYDAFTRAEVAMLRRTTHPLAPWTVIPADDKRLATLAAFRRLLGGLEYPGKERLLLEPETPSPEPFEPIEALVGGPR